VRFESRKVHVVCVKIVRFDTLLDFSMALAGLV
jgi:hypothetical protein